jgi:hypothetical protein
MTDPVDFAALIPNGSKYAVRVMETRLSMPAQTRELEPGLLCLAGLPIELPASWAEWRGARELDRMRKCSLVLLAVAPSADPEVYDRENRALEDRLQRYHGGLSICTPGYEVAFGRTIGGARRGGYLDARSSGEVVPYWPTSGTPRNWVITARHLGSAVAVGEALNAIRATMSQKADRLTRILYAFHLGLSSNVWDVRLHQFCRVLDGLAATDVGSGRRQFGDRCCRMICDRAQVHREFFNSAYDTRGAIEHLRGPIDVIRAAVPEVKTDDEAYLYVAYAAFALEQVARHALLHVCNTPALWPHMRDSTKARALWADAAGFAAALWREPLDLSAIQGSFDRSSAESTILLSS